jgi:hypothetical protein
MMAPLVTSSCNNNPLHAPPLRTVIHVRVGKHKPGDHCSKLAHAVAVDLVARVLDRPACGLGVMHAFPARRPVVSGLRTDECCAISVSHAAGFAAVAASARIAPVGIDVVRIADATSSLDWCICKEELPLGGRQDAFFRRAAKEAAFKASVVDAPFRPRRVSIKPRSERSFAWRRLTEMGWERGAGVWLSGDDHVVAVAAHGLGEWDEITIVDHRRVRSMNSEGFLGEGIDASEVKHRW